MSGRYIAFCVAREKGGAMFEDIVFGDFVEEMRFWFVKEEFCFVEEGFWFVEEGCRGLLVLFRSIPKP